MSGHKSYKEVRDARIAKLTPEGQARFHGYSAGFKDCHDMWEDEIANASLLHLWRLRRDSRRSVYWRGGRTS